VPQEPTRLLPSAIGGSGRQVEAEEMSRVLGEPKFQEEIGRWNPV
jgi:hypothetical protein